jgi:hypothetical protein
MRLGEARIVKSNQMVVSQPTPGFDLSAKTGVIRWLCNRVFGENPQLDRSFQIELSGSEGSANACPSLDFFEKFVLIGNHIARAQ